MLSNLKYIGTKTEALIEIYCLYIRSVLEYCSVAFHSSLTIDQSDQLEAVQRASLRVILGDNYVSSSAAREMTGLPLLSERRQSRVETFSRRAIVHPKHSLLFPRNQVNSDRQVREREAFKVNKARTDYYQDSAIIHCQKTLNRMVKEGKLKLDK